MEVKTISPVHIAYSSPESLKIIGDVLESGSTLRLPIKTPDEIAAANAIYNQVLRTNGFKALLGNQLHINVTLDNSHHAHEAMHFFNGVSNKIASTGWQAEDSSPLHPTISISHSMEAGAGLGGVAGLSAIFLAEGLKPTAPEISNPVCAGVGFVLAGLAVGAVGGAIFSKFKEIHVHWRDAGVELKTA
jgi:hypothetical protein